MSASCKKNTLSKYSNVQRDILDHSSKTLTSLSGKTKKMLRILKLNCLEEKMMTLGSRNRTNIVAISQSVVSYLSFQRR